MGRERHGVQRAGPKARVEGKEMNWQGRQEPDRWGSRVP